MRRKLAIGIVILVVGAIFTGCGGRGTEDEPSSQERADGAVRLSVPLRGNSDQNPVFSPDGTRLVFTRFEGGYNDGPAGLYLLDRSSGTVTRLTPTEDQDNVNLPGAAWNRAANLIVFASDREETNDIWRISPDDGDLGRVTRHSGSTWYIEPSWSPDGQWVVFEMDNVMPDDRQQGSIWKVRADGSGLTQLTSGYDDRQPNWSPMGDRILFQRRMTENDDWDIYTMAPDGGNAQSVTDSSSSDTDATWSPDGNWIVYSSDYGGLPAPNIFVTSVHGGTPMRVTFDKEHEDSAPSWSPDGKWIAFESRERLAETTPASLWIISVPDSIRNIEGKPSLENIISYANVYKDYTAEDLEKLKRFDIVAIEPYYVPDKRFLADLKASGTIILAYISIGEADDGRRYWADWEPADGTPDNPNIPRTIVTEDDPIFIGEDPGWEGSYFIDASNQKWHDIMLNEEIPYILWLGGGQYDGFMMDVVDVVDEYKGHPDEDRMRQGMINLIKEIKGKYPKLLLVPNRGFGILPEMAPYIDAFKFEEMTGAYGNIEGEEHYGKYYLKIDENGGHDNQEEIDLLLSVLKNHSMPVLVLDHVQTEPPDEKMARKCFEEAQRLSRETGYRFIWYGNSVDQDLPIWSFLSLKR